jgi:DNA repair protein RadC
VRHRGVEGLGDVELLGLLVGHARAYAVLQALGDLRSLGRAGPGLLEGLGLGADDAKGLVAALELARRIAAEPATERLGNAHAVATWARWMEMLDHEELWALALDGRSGLRAARRVAQGGLSGLHVAVTDPLRVALREGARAVVLVHNHPSGDAEPSEADVAFTKRVAAAAEVVGVPLVDHVIVARGGHVSLLERGWL